MAERKSSLEQVDFLTLVAMAPRPRLNALRGPLRTLHSCSRAAQAATASLALPATVASSLAAASAGSETTASTTSLNGWIRSVRRQKNVSFAVLSDGSQVGGVQVVLPKGLDERCVLPLSSHPSSLMADTCYLQLDGRMCGDAQGEMGRQSRSRAGQGVQGRVRRLCGRERRRGAYFHPLITTRRLRPPPADVPHAQYEAGDPAAGHATERTPAVTEGWACCDGSSTERDELGDGRTLSSECLVLHSGCAS